jgi:hypothetical protein
MPAMDQADLAALLPALLPLACEWASSEAARGIEAGEPLNPLSRADAIAVGVRDPDAVRVVIVDKIPQPEDYPDLMQAAQALRFLDETTIGLTLHSAIFIRSDYAHDRRLVAHELVHVAQYERLGSIPAFLAAYLGQVVQFGYQSAPMEQEAIAKAETVPDEALPRL